MTEGVGTRKEELQKRELIALIDEKIILIKAELYRQKFILIYHSKKDKFLRM